MEAEVEVEAARAELERLRAAQVHKQAAALVLVFCRIEEHVCHHPGHEVHPSPMFPTHHLTPPPPPPRSLPGAPW